MKNLIFCVLVLISMKVSLAQASGLVNHPITFTFLDNQGVPVSGLHVLNHEALVRQRCHGFLHEFNCKDLEHVETNALGTTNEQGKVTFIYDDEMLFNRTQASDKMRALLNTSSDNVFRLLRVKYLVDIRKENGQPFECYYASKGAFDDIYVDYFHVIPNETINSSDSQMTCKLK